MFNLVPSKNKKTFYRKERNNISLIFRETCGLEFFNKTGTEIYNLIDGEKNIGEIIEIMKNNYSSTDPQVIIQEVIKFLFSIKNIGAIRMKGDFKDMRNGFYFVGETEYEDVHKFLVSAIRNEEGYIGLKEKEFYNTIALRTRSFQLSEVFFAEYVEGQIKTVISVTGLDGTAGNVQIQSMSGENIEGVLKFTMEYLKSENVNKIKGVCYATDTKTIRFFETYGFKQECVLEKEMKGKDVQIMSIFI